MQGSAGGSEGAATLQGDANASSLGHGRRRHRWRLTVGHHSAQLPRAPPSPVPARRRPSNLESHTTARTYSGARSFPAAWCGAKRAARSTPCCIDASAAAAESAPNHASSATTPRSSA